MNSMLQEWASVMRELDAKAEAVAREENAAWERAAFLRDKRHALMALQGKASEALHCAALGRRQPDGATPNSIRTEAMAIDG